MVRTQGRTRVCVKHPYLCVHTICSRTELEAVEHNTQNGIQHCVEQAELYIPDELKVPHSQAIQAESFKQLSICRQVSREQQMRHFCKALAACEHTKRCAVHLAGQLHADQACETAWRSDAGGDEAGCAPSGNVAQCCLCYLVPGWCSLWCQKHTQTTAFGHSAPREGPATQSMRPQPCNQVHLFNIAEHLCHCMSAAVLKH